MKSYGTIPENLLGELRSTQETLFLNPNYNPTSLVSSPLLPKGSIEDTMRRFERFSSFMKSAFPETLKDSGRIESPLLDISSMKTALSAFSGHPVTGQLLLKKDSHLAVCGSVKARGGFHEIFKYAEELALSHGLIRQGEDYAKLHSNKYREFFGKYTIQVGSTGNLGMSIGILSRAFGFRVVVHMSSDAKEWKKQLLREKGVLVKEYDSDYVEAVAAGRRESEKDPFSYFVDDEGSLSLFMGYAAAAPNLKTQLGDLSITVDQEHPLFVYLPCGIGGAPGGITYGLKELFGANVHCFFAEPTEAPCMLLGMASGLHDALSVRDIGLSGKTQADGLAVARPSRLVGRFMEQVLSGCFTVSDEQLYQYMGMLSESERIFLEPSGCAGFKGPIMLLCHPQGIAYLEKHSLSSHMAHATHLVWTTGGGLVPDEQKAEFLNIYHTLSQKL